MRGPNRSRRPATLAAVLALAAFAVACGGPSGPPRIEDGRDRMGTYVRIVALHPDREAARAAIDAAYDEIDRLEALLSEWRPDSDISRVNDAAGGAAVAVGPELIDVLSRARDLVEATGGAFDPTFAACGRLYSMTGRVVPDDDAVARCRAFVGFDRVEIDEGAGTVLLPDEGMRLGIAAIAKGWILDRAAEVLAGRGIERFSVDGGGDIVLRGDGPRGDWRIGIAHPRASGTLYGTVPARDVAVVTSGDYLQGFDAEGGRVHHILDPRTGRPTAGAIAATVIAPDAATADALATGLMVLGARAGRDRAEALPEVEAMLIGPDLERFATSGFPPIQD